MKVSSGSLFILYPPVCALWFTLPLIFLLKTQMSEMPTPSWSTLMYLLSVEILHLMTLIILRLKRVTV